MRKKLICQAIILAGILAACGTNNKSAKVDESNVSVESSVASSDGREATDMKVVKKNVTSSKEETTTQESTTAPTSAAAQTATEAKKESEK